jgi:microcystin-dependent protein
MSLNWFNTTKSGEVSYSGNFKVIGDIEVTGLVRRNGEVFESITSQWNPAGESSIYYSSLSGSSRVGIGITNPTSTLDVAGDISFTGDIIQDGNVLNLGDSVWNKDENESTVFYGGFNARVGIGNGFLSGKQGGNNASGRLHVWDVSLLPDRWDPDRGIRIGSGELQGSFLQSGVSEHNSKQWAWIQSAKKIGSGSLSQNSLLINPDGGNVGIGVSKDNADATISIATRITNNLPSSFRKTISLAPETHGDETEYNSLIYSKYFSLGFRDTADKRGLHIITKTNNTSWKTINWDQSAVMSMLIDGKVGIGTIDPKLRLDITSLSHNGIHISNLVDSPGYGIQRFSDGLSIGPLPTGFSQINKSLTINESGIKVTGSISIDNNIVLSAGVLGSSIKTSSLESVGTLVDLNVAGKVKENGNELIPRGIIVAWTGSIAPNGWALCNGENGTPDLRGRFIYGFGSGKPFNERGGAETHTLTISEMPNHSHVFSANINAFQAFDTADNNEGYNTGGFGTTNTESVGSSRPHNNMPPYYVLAFIMKL